MINCDKPLEPNTPCSIKNTINDEKKMSDKRGFGLQRKGSTLMSHNNIFSEMCPRDVKILSHITCGINTRELLHHLISQVTTTTGFLQSDIGRLEVWFLYSSCDWEKKI